MIQASTNPMATIQGLMANNPQFRDLLPLIEKNNGDYRKTFYDLASQKGIDPNEILNLMNNAR